MSRAAPHPYLPPREAELAIPAPAPVVGDRPGCHDCRHWRRTFSTIGICQLAEPAWHQGWTTSYAYLCADHPSQQAAHVRTA